MPSENWSSQWLSRALEKIETKIDRIESAQAEAERRQARSIDELRVKVETRVETLIAKIDAQMLDVNTLKVKAGLWGGLAGLLPVIVYLAIRAIVGTR